MKRWMLSTLSTFCKIPCYHVLDCTIEFLIDINMCCFEHPTTTQNKSQFQIPSKDRHVMQLTLGLKIHEPNLVFINKIFDRLIWFYHVWKFVKFWNETILRHFFIPVHISRPHFSKRCELSSLNYSVSFRLKNNLCRLHEKHSVYMC